MSSRHGIALQAKTSHPFRFYNVHILDSSGILRPYAMTNRYLYCTELYLKWKYYLQTNWSHLYALYILDIQRS